MKELSILFALKSFLGTLKIYYGQGSTIYVIEEYS